MPYGYYQLVRFFAMIAFAYFAFEANTMKREKQVFIYIGLALLFQPFFKIPLGRELWNIIDVVVGLGLIVTLFVKSENRWTNQSTFRDQHLKK